MSDSVVWVMYSFYEVGLALAALLGGYAAYWAFGLRRALKVRAYSSQLLIVGSFSIYGTVLYFLFYIVYFFAPDLINTPLGTVQSALYLVLTPLALAWVDSSIRVGRRSDPLLRDPYHWSKLRLVLWPLLLLTLLGYLAQGDLSDIGLLSYVILGVSVLPIFQAARRSGDPHYRRSLEWFGFAIALLVAQNLGFTPLITASGLGVVYSPFGFFWSIFANLAIVPAMFYGIYMCARSLVPLNRISLG
jgi:uncharacterized membrane protein (DUF485 family)